MSKSTEPKEIFRVAMKEEVDIWLRIHAIEDIIPREWIDDLAISCCARTGEIIAPLLVGFNA